MKVDHGLHRAVGIRRAFGPRSIVDEFKIAFAGLISSVPGHSASAPQARYSGSAQPGRAGKEFLERRAYGAKDLREC
jgi:hypothetical protein